MSKQILIIGGTDDATLIEALKKEFGEDVCVHTTDEVIHSGLSLDKFEARLKPIVIEPVYQNPCYMPSNGQSKRRDRRKKNRK